MTITARFAVVLIFTCGCVDRSPRQVTNPVADVPTAQQRTIVRSDFGWQWPFTVGTGTLACASGAVMFRAGAVDYALNEPAKARALPLSEPILLRENSGPPRNPLPGVKQDTRMKIFAQSAACGKSTPEQSGATSPCKQHLRELHRLSTEDLAQIEAEGIERFWPPLVAPFKSLSPVVDAGLKLCGA